MSNVWQARRITRVIASIMTLLLLLCCAYIVAEAGHHCTGDHCPVCEHVHFCADVLQNLLAIGVCVVTACVALTLWRSAVKPKRAEMPVYTPVLLKVRQDR